MIYFPWVWRMMVELKLFLSLTNKLNWRRVSLKNKTRQSIIFQLTIDLTLYKFVSTSSAYCNCKCHCFLLLERWKLSVPGLPFQIFMHYDIMHNVLPQCCILCELIRNSIMWWKSIRGCIFYILSQVMEWPGAKQHLNSNARMFNH